MREGVRDSLLFKFLLFFHCVSLLLLVLLLFSSLHFSDPYSYSIPAFLSQPAFLLISTCFPSFVLPARFLLTFLFVPPSPKCAACFPFPFLPACPFFPAAVQAGRRSYIIRCPRAGEQLLLRPWMLEGCFSSMLVLLFGP